MSFLLNLLSANMSYSGAKAQAKAQRAWQEYSNRMTDLSHSVAQNAITTNEILASDALASQAVQLKKDSLQIQGAAKVNAAAAGVKGKSVSRQMRLIVGNAAARESERQLAFRNMMMSFDQQRLNTSMSAAMQKDYSYIPKPKYASYFLSAVQQTASEVQRAM